MVTSEGRRNQVNASWKPAIRSAHSSADNLASSGREESPPPRATDKSSPAEKDRPSPRTMTTRTSPGNFRDMSVSSDHMAGVCALSTSGRHNVTVATGPSWSYRTPTSDPGDALVVMPSYDDGRRRAGEAGRPTR